MPLALEVDIVEIRVGTETPLSVAVRPVRAGGHHGDVPRVRPTGGPHLLLLEIQKEAIGCFT